MLFKSYLAAGIFASGALAGTLGDRNRPVRCGAPSASTEQRAISKKFAAQEAAAREARVSMKADAEIKVYMHSVAASEADFLSEETMKKQAEVLAADFASAGFKFTLAGTTTTVNAGWAEDSDEMAMKKALRKGDYQDLNLYFLNKLTDDALGYCYLPEASADPGSETFIRDGCSIRADTVPGGTAPFDLGKTVVHETGHWMGLEHTFEGGCSAENDGVKDTPAQQSASSGCPTGRDSCPNDEGLDPIHNYMDYSDDSCYEEFTAGQKARMTSWWNEYRQGK